MSFRIPNEDDDDDLLWAKASNLRQSAKKAEDELSQCSETPSNLTSTSEAYSARRRPLAKPSSTRRSIQVSKIPTTTLPLTAANIAAAPSTVPRAHSSVSNGPDDASLAMAKRDGIEYTIALTRELSAARERAHVLQLELELARVERDELRTQHAHDAKVAAELVTTLEGQNAQMRKELGKLGRMPEQSLCCGRRGEPDYCTMGILRVFMK